jgi:hypothetical protein
LSARRVLCHNNRERKNFARGGVFSRRRPPHREGAMLPTVRLGEYDISRLIIGGNPFSGNSHVSRDMDDEMLDYFSTDRIKQILFDCEKHGLNTMQLRADRHITRIIREYRQDGGSMHWIAQTCPELGDFAASVRGIMSYKPIAIYHHGTIADNLFKAGNIGELKSRLAVMRGTGALVGLGTHMPELVEYSEEHGLDVDFYMTCVYNLSKVTRQSSSITGAANSGEPFDEEDREIMYKTVRAVPKPCLVFKILGATRRSATPADVEGAFREAFANIKDSDAVIVGMFPKYSDQVYENARLVGEICAGR